MTLTLYTTHPVMSVVTADIPTGVRYLVDYYYRHIANIYEPEGYVVYASVLSNFPPNTESLPRMEQIATFVKAHGYKAGMKEFAMSRPGLQYWVNRYRIYMGKEK